MQNFLRTQASFAACAKLCPSCYGEPRVGSCTEAPRRTRTSDRSNGRHDSEDAPPRNRGLGRLAQSHLARGSAAVRPSTCGASPAIFATAHVEGCSVASPTAPVLTWAVYGSTATCEPCFPRRAGGSAHGHVKREQSHTDDKGPHGSASPVCCRGSDPWVTPQSGGEELVRNRVDYVNPSPVGRSCLPLLVSPPPQLPPDLALPLASIAPSLPVPPLLQLVFPPPAPPLSALLTVRPAPFESACDTASFLLAARSGPRPARVLSVRPLSGRRRAFACTVGVHEFLIRCEILLYTRLDTS